MYELYSELHRDYQIVYADRREYLLSGEILWRVHQFAFLSKQIHQASERFAKEVERRRIEERASKMYIFPCVCFAGQFSVPHFQSRHTRAVSPRGGDRVAQSMPEQTVDG